MTQTASSEFSDRILEILVDHFGDDKAREIYRDSTLIGYLEKKTRAANRGSKSRGSFANLYAIYVLVEDYLNQGFQGAGGYSEYDGARFSVLFARQRQLPFGEKLQNHALNSRLNDEFHKFYPDAVARPIMRDVESQRYWFSESLLQSNGENLAEAVVEVIDAYVDARRGNFNKFLDDCRRIQGLDDSANEEKRAFVESLLSPTTDARLFEIASFAIMKTHYGSRTVWFGWTEEAVAEESLVLYKTGRTNANDGGIDFVMRPVGRFFQVTETLDVKKYFLDIDKLQKFPITFVVKTGLPIDTIRTRLREGAETAFGVTRIVEKYMGAVEEIVNIPRLMELVEESIAAGRLSELIGELVLQSQVEFHLSDDEEEMIKALPTTEAIEKTLDI